MSPYRALPLPCIHINCGRAHNGCVIHITVALPSYGAPFEVHPVTVPRPDSVGRPQGSLKSIGSHSRNYCIASQSGHSDAMLLHLHRHSVDSTSTRIATVTFRMWIQSVDTIPNRIQTRYFPNMNLVCRQYFDWDSNRSFSNVNPIGGHCFE
jgi:hypothetical protein